MVREIFFNSTSFRIGNEICPGVLGQKGSKKSGKF
jgi:hypothetical protein